jgi:type I restriction enzyme S subunit
MLKFRWETEFKETEIGEIPKDWEITNLGDNRFFKILPSGIKKFEGYKEYLSTSSVEGNEIVKIEEFITYNKRPSRANMQPVENSVWLARMINSPKFLKANKDLIENKILSTGFLGIQTKVKVTCDYLFYYIQTKEFQEYKDAYVTGAVQESLTNENAKELLVILPPLPEQSRIANVLSYFDDLIEVKKRQNEILEKTAMAIFKSWFIDFEPFKACPEQERGNCEFVYNEELGKEIPKGWEVKKWGDVVNFFDNQRIPLSEVERLERKGQYPYYGANGIIDYINDYIFDGKYLLVAEDGTVMDKNGFAIINIVEGKFWANNHVHVIQGKDIPIDYLYLHLKHYPIEPYITGAVQPKLSQENFSKMPIFLPPSHILQSFHSLVEPLFQKIILNQKQVMTLRKIRDTLLPLLVFGKLRIEEV